MLIYNVYIDFKILKVHLGSREQDIYIYSFILFLGFKILTKNCKSEQRRSGINEWRRSKKPELGPADSERIMTALLVLPKS